MSLVGKLRPTAPYPSLSHAIAPVSEESPCVPRTLLPCRTQQPQAQRARRPQTSALKSRSPGLPALTSLTPGPPPREPSQRCSTSVQCRASGFLSRDPEGASGSFSGAGRVGRVLCSGNFAEASFGPVAQAPKEGAEATGDPPKQDLGAFLSSLLPFIVVAASVAALVHPPSFTWFKKQYYPAALGGIMLSIGMQLTLEDFETVLKRPQAVILGLTLQYAIKPAIGLLTVALFRVPPQFAAGLILTACVSGAQLASFATSLAKGPIALTVVLTSLSTVMSVVLTPALSKWLVGAVIPVDALGMAKSILQVVILPIALGLFLNAKAKPLVDRARPFMPLLAIFCTTCCIGSPLAFNRGMLLSWQGLALVLPVLFFHVASTAAGYWAAQLPGMRQDEATARTLALNGAMQSSALAMLLATQFLGGLHPVPAACSVVIMSVFGLSLGSFWGRGHSLRDMAGRVWKEGKEDIALQMATKQSLKATP